MSRSTATVVGDVAPPEEAGMIPPDEFFLRMDAPAAAPNLLLEDIVVDAVDFVDNDYSH